MKLHLRAFIAVAVLLFGTTMSFAQQNNQDVIIPTWGVELGYRNGIVYEHPISKHFTMRYSTGILAYHRLLLDPIILNDREMSNTQFRGFMPFINIGTRWYPKVMPNNSGFYLGIDVQCNLLKWKIPEKDYYNDNYSQHDEYEGLFMFNVGYMYNIADRFNIKVGLLPTGGIFSQAVYPSNGKKEHTIYGVIDLRWDLGLVYNF
ncbi:hypothetical protein [Porphyromonas levii]|uniref:hypothetical protein n=1 Tax=Porphyromonas levii TaxID=28114 RepID=UPI001B8CB4A2|nr:hypothetical protein [Porphyromonas levii]MBR8759426.1 hypothetical protein [Porphyromonas levii]